MSQVKDSGYAVVDGGEMYWESRGDGGTPLVLVHGGYGLASDFAALSTDWARDRRVFSVELPGHGHSRKGKAGPFRWEELGEDLASLIEWLGLGEADLLGLSLGGGASLRCAIQHPELVRRLVIISAPHRQSAWFPEIHRAWEGMNAGLFEQFQHNPLYAAWSAVAPDVSAFPDLLDATGELLRTPYDWSSEVAALPMPVLLVFGDADSMPPAVPAEFFGLLGGGQRDAGWDGAARPPSRLAILPGATHYDMLKAPSLPQIVTDFLAAQLLA
jgi:pimeloyl-ACP methyl ester carboxylesterase